MQHFAELGNVIFQEGRLNVTSHPLAIITEVALVHLQDLVNAYASKDMTQNLIAKIRKQFKYLNI